MHSSNSAIIFDLEFTAWEGSLSHRWLRPGEYTEIVQIGAVKMNTMTLEIIDRLFVSVRPRINREISGYLEKLIGMTNAELELSGVDFAEAYARFLHFVGASAIYAFGRDDLIFESNFRLYGLFDLPQLPPYTNLISWLIEQGMDPRGMHACDVGPMAGVPFSGQIHNALDDAHSVAHGVAALVNKGARNPFMEPG